MRVLLDTNIVIYRESRQATNESIGLLFYWLDKLGHDKLIHPWSVKELRTAENVKQQKIYDARLSAYQQMKSIAPQTDDFKNLLGTRVLGNDVVDNQLLYEVYCGRADLLITEDRKMRDKANALGIGKKVFSVNSFIEKCTSENPDLIDYEVLSVRKEYFGNIDVQSPFFDTFRDDYVGFNDWFAKKSDEEAYICRADDNRILGFLYVKTEEPTEDYSDITPRFSPKRRLKVGTFKVESTGFRLGERFIKIIFDNALERKVDEIYVTLFTNRQELEALHSLLERWGFVYYGTKVSGKGEEVVLVKKLGVFNDSKTVRENYPNILYNRKKFFLPILPQYHTLLLPDSKLTTENEVDFLGEEPQKYALQKVYISFTPKRNMSPGDFLVVYRNGERGTSKAYTSVLTTVGVIDEVRFNFKTQDEFLGYCENRTVFSGDELKNFWRQKREQLLVVKFVYVKSLTKRLFLKYLWDTGIITPPGGPRPFDEMSDAFFDKILFDSGTAISFVGKGD